MSNGFLLDTNVPSELTKPSPDLRVTAWVSSHDDLHLSVVSVGELRRGLSLLAPGRRRSDLEDWFANYLLPLVGTGVLPITQAIAERWGRIGADCQTRGVPVPLADGLIAATALEHNLTVVTRNVKDFMGLGIRLINPWEP